MLTVYAGGGNLPGGRGGYALQYAAAGAKSGGD